MQSTLSFRKRSQIQIVNKINHSRQGTPKLKVFLKDHSQPMRLSPLSKLLTDECHFPKFILHESPIAAKINSFENEDSILNQLSQSGNTPERVVDDVDNVRQSIGKKFPKSVHKNKSVSRGLNLLPMTYKYSNKNSVGTRKLERFLQEYSQEPWNTLPSNVWNVPDTKSNTKNTISLTNNPLTDLKNETPKKKSCLKNTFRKKKISSSSDSSVVSSKSIRRKSTLLDYFKETKNIRRSIGKSSSSKASDLICLGISSSNSGSNVSFSDHDLIGCARTKIWPKKELDVVGKEGKRKDNRNARNSVGFMEKNREEEYSSSLLKGLDFIEEFDKEYDKSPDKHDSFKSRSKSQFSSYSNHQRSVDMNLKSIPERKTQKNLYSSEGFCEEMSLETPLPKIDDNIRPNLSFEKNPELLKPLNSQDSGFRKKHLIRDTEKFKELSTFIHSLCSQQQKLTQRPERRKLTPSEERELSPGHYVMKMCGPESEAMVKSILNSNNNEEDHCNNLLKLTNNSNIRNKDSPSDPLSFGSPIINFSQNANCTQVNKVPASLNRQREGVCKNSQITQNKEKLNSQTRESLFKLHESNSWHTQEQTENLETFKKQYSVGKNLDPTQSFTKIIQERNHNKELQHVPKGVSESFAVQKPLSSAEIFGPSSLEFIDNVSLFPTSKNYSFNTKVKNTQVINDLKYIPTHAGEAKSPILNTQNDQFLQKLLSQHFENALIKNYNDLTPEKIKNLNSQSNVCQIQGNGVTVKNSEGRSKTNYEELEKITETQPLTDGFTENILGTQAETQNVSKKLKKTYNLSKDCVLYEDNLLKSLMEEEGNIWKITQKEKVLKRKNSEEQLKWGCSYIKRYKKGNTKIFKMKRRIRKKDVKNERPAENQIMDRFLKKLNNDFDDESSCDLANNEDDESVSTPVSYKTDETKSEVLSTGSSKLTDTQKLLRQGINTLSKDKSLLFSKFEDYLPHNFDKNEILANIEHILNTILDDFKRDKNPYFRVPKEGISNCIFADGRYNMKEPPEYTRVSYKSGASRQKFNLILFLLNKIKHLLQTDTKLTKREIYYQLKTMIASQGTTDRALKDISRMLNVGMWALNITAQKGLVYGNLKLVMADGETLNCNVPGTLIPHDISKICEVQSTAYFILVVEKESIFHKLLEENLPNKLTRPFVLITGKGYPDLNTQRFLKMLWMIMSIPVFILVDADPDGISIMLTYRFGSIANAHISEHLAIPKAKWLGVFPSELSRLTLSEENLSRREISMTQKLLQLECVRENENIKMQLEKLLENGIKTGIEGLIKSETYLSNYYLSWKFFTNNLI